MTKTIIDILQLNFTAFIIASFVIITKISSLLMQKTNRHKINNIINFLTKQSIYIPLVVIAIYLFELSFPKLNIKVLINYHYIKHILEILKIVLVIVIVFQEERLIYSYIKKRRLRNQTFAIILPLIRNSLRLSFIAFILPFLISTEKFPLSLQKGLDKAIDIFIIWAVVWLVMRIFVSFEKVAHIKLNGVQIDDYRGRGALTKIRLLKRIVFFIVIVVGLGCTFMLFSHAKNIGTSIFASAGLITAIIGFSAQKPLSSLIEGLQITFNEIIKLNDTVIVEKEFGTIEEIYLTYAVVKLWDLRRLIVPVGYFLKQPFLNLTRSSTAILCPITFYTDYSLPVDKVRQHFLSIIGQSKSWDGEVSTFVVVDTFEKTIQVRALASAKNAGDASELKYEILEKLIGYIRDNFPECLPKATSK